MIAPSITKSRSRNSNIRLVILRSGYRWDRWYWWDFRQSLLEEVVISGVLTVTPAILRGTGWDPKQNLLQDGNMRALKSSQGNSVSVPA